ncbi:MAG: hypothetical protein AAFR42_02955 [Cyanobacteria bacterium J06628_6]
MNWTETTDVSNRSPGPNPLQAYDGLGSVVFFTVLLLVIVLVKRLPKERDRPGWSRRLLDWL